MWEGHMSYNQLWLLKVLQHLKLEEKLSFRPLDNTFVSVLQRSTEAFPGVRSARKEVVWIEGDTENALPLLFVCFSELWTSKKGKQTTESKSGWLCLEFDPPPFFPPFQFFLEFWRYMVFIFRLSCLFWFFTDNSYKLMNAIFSFCSSQFPFNNMSGLQSANPVFHNTKTIALVLSWFLS